MTPHFKLSRRRAARTAAMTAAALALVAGSSLANALTAAAGTAAEQVTVSATRLPMKSAEALSELSVLAREAIERSQARTLAELLATLPGLQPVLNGGLGKPAALLIRGQEARHTLLLVDGVRVGSATLNQPSLDNLPLGGVERIELMRGPMSTLYGSNAMGGVVQVVTRRAQPGLQGDASVAAGSNGHSLASAAVRYGQGALDLAAQVQILRTDGYSATDAAVPFGQHDPDDDGFAQRAASLRAGLALGGGWRADALLLDSRGRTQYDDGIGADALARLVSRVQSLRVAGPVRPGWRMALQLGRADDIYDTVRSASPWAELGAIATRQTQLAWENELALPLGRALLLVEQVRQSVGKPAPDYEVTGRRIDSAAAVWDAALGAHRVQLSARRDRNSQFGGRSTGAMGWGLEVAPGWRVGASAAQSWNAPSFNDLYYPGFSNPALQPEEGRHAELFAEWRGAAQALRATLYRNRWNGYISGGPNPGNVPKVAIDGATLSGSVQFGGLALNAALDLLDARNDTAGSANDGKPLARRAPRALKAGAQWSMGAWRVDAALQAYARRFDDAANTVRLAGYTLLDLGTDWALARDWRLGLRLNNALGRDYQTAQGYNSAPRGGIVTLRWEPK